MIFGILFLVLGALCIFCMVYSARLKRNNAGYILMALLTACSNFACFAMIFAGNATVARISMAVYYLCHIWLYFIVLQTICILCRFKERSLFSKRSLWLCVAQTVILAVILMLMQNIEISGRQFLGSSWWMACDINPKPSFFSLGFFGFLCLLNSLLLIYVLVICYKESAMMFRYGFIAVMVYQVFAGLYWLILSGKAVPLWVDCLGADLLCFVGFYVSNFYLTDSIRAWAFRSFTNDMSDGVILYNEHRDLIHMNDVIKRELPEELYESFRDKNKLTEWINDTVKVERQLVQVCHKGDEDVYFKVRCVELAVRDRIYATMYIFHDTTESIQEMKAMARANRELERAAKMKSDFLANMSHEIRTPMNAVIGMAEIALREDLPDNVREYLGQIQNSGHSLLNIINDILDLSKIESGKMEILPEKYEPLSEINDIANVLMTRVGDKPLELFVITKGYIPRVLEGDAMRIRQIIINLVNNAIKFTQHGTVKIIVTGEKMSDDEVMLNYHVVDTGQGIKEEDLGKLFVSFQQVDSKRNRSKEGTGLGLAISRKLCEAMGGSMGVTSEYGKGSDFYFNIPQKIADPEEDILVDEASGKRIICIFDNQDMRQAFEDGADKLGLDSRFISSLKEYVPGEKKDYIFFEPEIYEKEIKAFLDKNPSVTGVILEKFGASFVPSQPNLRVMRRPLTTPGFVMILNDREIKHFHEEDRKDFVIDFITPEAKFLVVDDNMINITIAEGLLAPLKAKVFSADSGLKAIEMVREQKFDIIFMDHMMPEMDGIEATHIIRKSIPFARLTPVIALTANAMEGAKDMFLKEGMNDLVTKPIDIRELILAVKRALPSEKIVDIDPEEQESETAKSKAASGGDIIYYDGLDVDGAIAAIGMPALYNKIVEEYYRSGDKKYQDIRTAYDKGDWKDYTIKVHALKSSSRQIGAAGLGDLAEKLEKAGKGDDLEFIHGATEGLLEDYRALLNRLSPYFPEETAPEELEQLTAEELDSLLGQLLQACDELDMDEMERVRDELKGHALPGGASEHIGVLCEAIDNLDAQECVRIVEIIRGVI